MRNQSAALASLCLALVLTSSHSVGQTTGSIRGTVINDNGDPVAAAQVRVDPLMVGPRSDAVRLTETDTVGRFIMNNLDLTSYKVFAMKESAGYPNTAFGFYSHNIFPTVTLTASVPTANITLKVGPPSGVMLGSVTDAATGALVSAGFLLRGTSDPNNWISMSQKANYRVLVPPSVEVTFEVSAPGYQTWYYGGSSDPLKRAPIRLKSGEEMRLNIQLEPKDKSSNGP